MRKKRILPLLCSLLTSIYSLVPQQSQAEQSKKPSWYLGSSLELSTLQSPQNFRDAYNRSLSYGINLGFLPQGHISIRAPIRVSEFSDRRNANQKLKMRSVGIDILLHAIPTNKQVSPYVKAGASYTNAKLISADRDEGDAKENRLAINSGLGVIVNVSKFTSIDIGGDYNRVQTTGTPIDFWSAGIGLNFHWGN